MKLFYREAGTTGPVLVIVHGVFGSADNWLTIGKQLGEMGYHVFMLDQRNHGRSPWSDEFGYREMAEDLHEFLVDHQLSNVTLIGHSMGGKSVMQFAFQYPLAFERLVIVDIAPRFYPIHHDEILRGMNTMPLTTLRTRQEAETYFADFEDDPGTRAFILKNLYRTDDGTFAWRLNLSVLSQNISVVGSDLACTDPIEQPTLFMRGENSPYITQADETIIHKMFTSAHLDTISNAGHWIQAEEPEAFLESLLGFLEVNPIKA